MVIDAKIKIAPSILSADFSQLGRHVKEADDGGADYIHVDVMDGHFVPNLTLGPLVLQSIRPWTELPLDVHLMITEPDKFIDRFVDAGADIITVHAEACSNLISVVKQIKQAGVSAGVAISPDTSVGAVEGVLPDLDQVTIMTVHPGFGGQTFIKSMVEKIELMRAILDKSGFVVNIEVDGGIDSNTAKKVVRAGAQILVAGSAVFDRDISVADAIASIRNSATDSFQIA